jgi:triosephosphate isomerase
MSQNRSTIIAGNWKMNKGPVEAAQFAKEILPPLAQFVQSSNRIQCILCPPTISLDAVYQVLESLPASQRASIELGAQNMYFEESGAFTGETSPTMVRELCSVVILGHSERRMYFGETDELVNKKAHAAFQFGLRPIICIGENERQHDSGQTEQVIHAQVQGSLSGFTPEQAANAIVAYEPIWAIGTGKAATPEDAEHVIARIRQLYCDIYDVEIGQALHILYGGSVTSQNSNDFLQQPDIDGALIGGASIKPDFVEIVRKTIDL